MKKKYFNLSSLPLWWSTFVPSKTVNTFTSSLNSLTEWNSLMSSESLVSLLLHSQDFTVLSCFMPSKLCMPIPLCTEISNLKTSWFAKMVTWNLSIWEPVRNLITKLPEKLLQSLVLQITWLLKFFQVKVTITLLICGHLVLYFMSLWLVMFLSVKMLRIHMKFIKKFWRILSLSPNIWETQFQTHWFLNYWVKIQTQDSVDHIQTWRNMHFSMASTGINW